MTKTKQIFIVGSSRSGTTMMGRILGNHPNVFTFKEIHFFGTIWTNQTTKVLDKIEQINLLSRLLCIQENGLFHQDNISDFNERANILLEGRNMSSPLSVYELFLTEISSDNKCEIACEQTPKNMYYLSEILKYFPEAKVINMVRDQRDVLLSQKNKWKRRFLGASKIPLLEAFRSFVNYHPILTAKVWNSSLLHTSMFLNEKRVKVVKFEDILANAEGEVKGICAFLDIDFQFEMLNVPVVGSSTEKDIKTARLIDGSKIEKWKKGGLNNAEIYLSQLMAKKSMLAFNYKLRNFSFPPILVLYYLMVFPVKIGIAFLINIRRMGSIVEVIRKRFFIK